MSRVSRPYTDSESEIPTTNEMQDLSGRVTKQEKYPFNSGGYGEVYKGTYRRKSASSSVVVAIKVLRNSYRPDSDEMLKLKTRLLREGRVWSALNHPNITPFYGVCYDITNDKTPCLICPFYKNGNIVDYLKTHPDANRLDLLAKIADGIAYLHARRPPIIHGDIKAANILINDIAQPCVADFGLSRILETSGFTTTTIGGSVRWMAYELLVFPDDCGESEVNAAVLYTTKSDVWAFAMTAIEVLTSKIPFPSHRIDAAVVAAISSGERPRRESYPGIKVSNSIWSMLEPCWSMYPARRPTMADVAGFLGYKVARYVGRGDNRSTASRLDRGG